LKVFNSVKPFLGSIQWQQGQDFCPDTLYLDGVSIEQTSNPSSKQESDVTAIEKTN
jgi:hypothetical protein